MYKCSCKENRLATFAQRKRQILVFFSGFWDSDELLVLRADATGDTCDMTGSGLLNTWVY